MDLGDGQEPSLDKAGRWIPPCLQTAWGFFLVGFCP
jgi:hypothetical protein